MSETNSQSGNKFSTRKTCPKLHCLWPCVSSFFSLHQIWPSLAPATCTHTYAYHTLTRTHTHHRRAHTHTPFPLEYLDQLKAPSTHPAPPPPLPGGSQSGTQWSLGKAPAAQDFTQCSCESSSRRIVVTPCTHTYTHLHTRALRSPLVSGSRSRKLPLRLLRPWAPGPPHVCRGSPNVVVHRASNTYFSKVP